MNQGSTLKLSKVVLGSMGFSEPAHAQHVHAIHAAIDHGMTTIDTAPLYGAGESEKIVGKAVVGRRDRVQLLTKCGLRWDTEHGQVLFSVERHGKKWAPRRDSRPTSIAEEIDRSLTRLGTDYIDLMQVHHLDYDTPVEDTMEALLEAQAAGKIRAFGVSNYPLQQLDRARVAANGALRSTQNLFNMLRPDQELEVLRYASRHEMAFLAYSPLAEGVLGGRCLRGATPSDRGYSSAYRHPTNVKRVNRVLVETAEPMAKEHGVTLAQLTLLWTLSQPGVTAAIVGGRDEKQLLDCAGVLDKAVPPAELQMLGQKMKACGWEAAPGLSPGQRLFNIARRGKNKLTRLVRGPAS